ncbi:unnamed protein product [Parajaminaea phylloscopi]
MSTTSAPPLPSRLGSSSTLQGDQVHHARFLLEQTRASLKHLHATQALDAVTYRDVDERLSRAVLRERAEVTTDGSVGLFGEESQDIEEVKLGKRNAWLRKAFAETSLLPTLVETALTTVAGPFLGDVQIEAIVDLVEMSQASIGERLTDPTFQRNTSNAAFAGLRDAGVGVNRSMAAVNASLSSLQQSRAEKRVRARAQKKERDAMKAELKQERAAMRRRLSDPPADLAPQKPGFAQTKQANTGGVGAVSDAEPEGSGDTPWLPRYSKTFVPWDGVTVTTTIAAAPRSRRSVQFAEKGAHSVDTDCNASEAGPSRSTCSLGESHSPVLGVAVAHSLPSEPPAVTDFGAAPASRGGQSLCHPTGTAAGAIPQRVPPGESCQPRPPLMPPPQHHSRPAVGDRRLSNSERAELPIATSEADRPLDVGPADSGSADDKVTDVTDIKRKGWKSRLLG